MRGGSKGVPDKNLRKLNGKPLMAYTIEQALQSGEPVAVQNALLKWGNSVWSDDPPQGLEQIGDRIPKLKKGIKSLNSALYGSKKNDATFEELKNDFLEMNLDEIEANQNLNKSDLSPLYPE